MLRRWIFLAAYWFLMICALVGLCSFPTEPQEKKVVVVEMPIPRNAAWNDFQRQCIAAHDDILIVRKFLVEHQNEVRVNVYDVPTFRAMDNAEAELKAAEADLQKIHDELSYREEARTR
jgi:hypothetical protein